VKAFIRAVLLVAFVASGLALVILFVGAVRVLTMAPLS